MGFALNPYPNPNPPPLPPSHHIIPLVPSFPVVRDSSLCVLLHGAAEPPPADRNGFEAVHHPMSGPLQ